MKYQSCSNCHKHKKRNAMTNLCEDCENILENRYFGEKQIIILGADKPEDIDKWPSFNTLFPRGNNQ